ncbi:MAG TPA: ribbon-helix-helix domain-containing protein [Candidatus Dormibacteraeota bacterium]|nr:ribbon-helix-helix domain-containing protein [Candidatus Dormibacteraeota bacterium]
MRLQISLDDDLIKELDERVGRRRRSAFVTSALKLLLEDQRRWDQVGSALGTVDDSGHDWDLDPQSWVAHQRVLDPARVG